MTKLRIFGLLMLVSKLVFAHSNTFAVNSYEENFGLLFTVHQGKNTLWLGGENGLYGVNGNLTIHFNEINSKLTSDVWDIVEDESGNVWAATQGNGVFVYSQATNTNTIFDIRAGLSSSHCWRISLWGKNKAIVTCVTGLHAINLETGLVTDLLELTDTNIDNGISELAVDSQKNIWFSQSLNGLYRINKSDYSIVHFPQFSTDSLGANITSLLVDSNDHLWIATELGVTKYNPQTKLFSKITSAGLSDDKNIRTILETKNRELWFAGESLFQLKQDKLKLAKPKSLFPMLQPNNSGAISDMTEGLNGEIYYVAFGVGLATIPASKKAFHYLTKEDDQLVGNISDSLLLGNGDLIFVENNDLYKLVRKSSDVLLLSKRFGYADSMLEIKSGVVLISTSDGGLKLVDTISATINSLSSHELGLPDASYSDIYGMGKDNNGIIYLGLFGDKDHGIYEGTLNAGFKQVKGKIQIDNIYIDKLGNKYFVSRNGKVLQQDLNGSWIEWQDGSSQEQLINNCILEDSNGVVWLCTNGKGIGYLDWSKKSIQYIDSSFTAGSSDIRELVEDTQGFLWVATNKGLVRFNPIDKTSIRIGKEDGILDKDFEITASLNLNGSNILIAGDKYNYVIDTELANRLLDSRLKQTTDISLLDIRVSSRQNQINESQSKTFLRNSYFNERLTLSYDDFLFTLKFAANNYIDRDILGFEYRLIGLNDNWIKGSPEEASATYSTLPSGDYEFQLRVVDPKSIAEQPVTRLSISVLPPYWHTWQAYLIYVFIGFVTLFSFYRYRTNQLKSTNLRLEKSVQQRTFELAKSNQYITSLLEQKQSLFANVSHEFRTPLSLIIAPLEALGKTLTSSGQKYHYDMISRNTNRLTLLVDQVLELAKLDTEKSQVVQVYSISHSIDVLVDSFKALADSRKQKLIVINQCVGVLELTTDSLEKIVSNLLSNAIRYTPEGGCIIVTTSRKNDQFILDITDDGPGIAPQDQGVIFERFTRLNHLPDITGSGLGLAVVKELVETNGGTIAIESQKGNGTKFIVSFCISKLSEDQVNLKTVSLPYFDQSNLVEEQGARSYSTSSNHDQHRTILIVEDNPDMRSVLVNAFESSYVCKTSIDGESGFALAKDLVPDLIITDLMMPKKNGFQLTELIRTEETTSHIPIIMLTAKGDDASRMTSWEKDIDDYIAKPFNVEDLKLRVSRLISIRDILRKRYSRQVSDSFEQNVAETSVSFSNKKDRDFYSKFISVIETHHASVTFSRTQASSLMAMSERQLNRKLAALIDHNFSEYLRKFRMEKARQLLLEGRQITEVSYDVGFSSPSYFSSCFKAEFGLTPKEYIHRQSVA